MKKLSKNPIDQYFRQNLESPDLVYNKQDWKGLEEMLPKKPKKKSAVWWLPASVAAAVALLFISFLLFNKPVVNTEKVASNKVKVFEADKTSVHNKETNTSQSLSESSSTAPITSGYSTKILPKSLLLTNLSGVNTSVSGNAGKAKEMEDREPGIPLVPLTGELNLNHSGNLYAHNISLIDLDLLIPQAPDHQVSRNNPDENLRSRFSLGLSFSPDINSINKFSKSSFGSSAGIAVSYKISPRLSVSTAVAYSKKIYSAEPYEYKAPWAYSSAGRNAESIDADCRVLDIPLNLSYNIIESPKRTIFASAGLSSYFMLKEKYTLIADSKPSGYPAYPNPSYAYSNKNQHLLSVVNLSAGISKPVSKQTSLVVEPYMRLPVTGIGQGKVHLRSIGLNLQLKYNLKKSGLSKSSPVGVVQ
ncbi:MAG TPA: hypothetical protein VLZ28_09525 [Daejeonella sp.]|nr:hypothetical protein [Daejeonella sp.]